MNIEIRPYRPDDCPELAELFYDTVHTVNRADYSNEQLNAWASGHVDINAWNRSFLSHKTVIAEIGSVIVGFGDIDISVECSICAKGYIDRLYVHRDYQRRGIGRAIISALEKYATENAVREITTYASLTAKPFFEAMGYTFVCRNEAERNGVTLDNCIMKKYYDNVLKYQDGY